MSAAWLKWLCFFGGVALASCAHLDQRQFAAAVDRFQSDAAFRAKAIGPQIWVTETTIWQDAEGFDRTISCTAIRPLEWFTQRGYRMIPTAEEASREGLTIGKKTYSAVTAAVTVGSPKSPPDAIYSFYRDEGEWNLAGVEIFSRQVAENGRPPAPRCVATEP
jgi:hypothetical protein